MKKLIYIIFCFLALTCKNNEKSNLNTESVNIEDTTIDFKVDNNEKTENLDGYLKNDGIGSSINKNEFGVLTSQKLEEYFDLIQLKQQHPEFKDDIILQLQKFSNDSTIGKNYPEGYALDNVRIAEYLESNTNSIKKLKLYFDVVQNESKKKDSIYAFINQRQTMIDNQETTSYKVRFSKASN